MGRRMLEWGCEMFGKAQRYRLTCLFWRGGPINSFGSGRRPIRTQEMADVFEHMSEAITSMSTGLTVFSNENLRVLGREE